MREGPLARAVVRDSRDSLPGRPAKPALAGRVRCLRCAAALGVLGVSGLLAPLISHALADTGNALAWLIDLAANLQWLFLMLLLPAAAMAARLDRRWALLLLALPLPWLSAAPAAPSADANSGYAGYAQAGPARDDASLSIASANVFLRNHDVRGLAQWLERERPDVVVVLEVTPAYAAGLQTLTAYPHRHIIPAAGAFGIAILSRYPLEQVQVVRDAEEIALIRAKIRWRGQLVGLAALHPMPPQSSHYHSIRNRKLQSLADSNAAGDLPMIIAGDLNATPWSNAFAGLEQQGWRRATSLLPTWPAAWRGWMGIPIDHVLVNRRWAVASAVVGPNLGSDHLPVLVRLVLQPPLEPPAVQPPANDAAGSSRR